MAVVAIALLFVIMLGVSARWPRIGLLAVVALAPWNGVDLDIGLRISAYQVSLAALLLTTFRRSLRAGWRPSPVAAARLLAAFALFATLWSLLQLAFVPETRLGQGDFRLPVVRALFQIVLFVFSLSPAVLIAWSMRGLDDLKLLLRTYFWSVFILALLGWAQLIVWYATGNNPLPIYFLNDLLGGAGKIYQGVVDFALLDVRRMNSLAGEPRTLGCACVFAMLLIQAIALTAPRWDKRKLVPLWLFLLVSAFATYSTSAVALWLIGSTVLLVGPRLFGVRLIPSPLQISAVVLALVTPLVLAVAVADAQGLPILDLIADRTVQRLVDNGAVEDFDLAIIDFLTDRQEYLVFGTGLGNAHLYSAPYLAPEFLWYAEGSVFSAKTQYLRIISELGFVGLTLFLTWYGVLVVEAARGLRRPSVPENLAPIVPIALMIITVYLAASTLASEFWIVAGAISVAVNATRGASAVFPAPVRPVRRSSTGLPA